MFARFVFPLFLITFTALPVWAQDVIDRDALFVEANRLYQQEEFEQARYTYLELAEANLSPEVFYNLASCYFRLNKLGRASLWYRRALQLDPLMVEASQNLRLLKRKLSYVSFQRSELDRMLATLPQNAWTMIAICGGWIFVLAMTTLLIFRFRQPLSGLLVGLTICGIIVAILGGTASYLHRASLNPNSLAIVVSEEVVAVTGPFPGAQAIVSLPEGTELRIRANRESWVRVQIPGNDLAGWVKSDEIEPLWPFDAKP